MNILLVRHARAVEPEEFAGDDGLRPLTAAGRREARAVFRALARFYPAPETIVSSQAVRAIQTADVLAEVFPRARREQAPRLNPGCDFDDFRRWLRDRPAVEDRLALVGHQPDIARILAGCVADGKLNIAVPKAACIEVDCNRQGRGELTLLFPPWALEETPQP